MAFSRLLTQEVAVLLKGIEGEVQIFDLSCLPLRDDAPEAHPDV